MSPVRVTWSRTVGRARNYCSTALAVGLFVSAAAVLLMRALSTAEGGRLAFVVQWASSVSFVLPFLAALLGMGVWSDERGGGRLALLLSAPVRERDLVVGKFLGVFTLVSVSVLLSLASTLVATALHSPGLLKGLSAVDFLPAVAALLLQGSLWSALAVAASAFCRRAALAAAVTMALSAALPRALWAAVLAWAPSWRGVFGEYPPDAHVSDIASGAIPFGIVVGYALFSAVLLYAASKHLALARRPGRRRIRGVFVAAFATVLAFAAAGSVTALAVRANVLLDIPVGADTDQLSARTRGILSDAQGTVDVTCFLSRRDPRFRETSRLLRQIRRAAESVGGVTLRLNFTDPSWDLGSASRLVRLGVQPASIVFERGRRRVSLPLAEGAGERECASAVLQLSMPPQRRNVYWTRGHGEASVDDYGPWGLSDIARELARDGYRNHTVNLSDGAQIPSDCALIVVAGAKDDFSRAELDRIGAYLGRGGRLLAFMSSAESGGVSSVLPAWGVIAAAMPAVAAKTLDGADTLATELSAHPVTQPLAGSQLVFERPLAFSPSAAVGTVQGADGIGFSALASAGGHCLAAAVERGGGTGADLALRPTRIVAVGDASFPLNAQLSRRASANRDFILNAVAFLSGTDAMTSSGSEGGRFVFDLDRAEGIRMLLDSAVAFPAAVVLLLVAVAFRRRVRS